MKRIIKIALVAVLVILASVSCKKDPIISSVSTVTISVNMPSDFPATAKYAGYVILQDRNSDQQYTVQAVDGKAIFENVIFGVYDASVASTLSYDAFKAAAPELAENLSCTIALNGYVTELSLVDETASTGAYSIDLTWSIPGSLVISKVYSFGTLNLNDKPYNIDKYWEIYNNSDQVQYVDGICIGEAYGSAVSTSVYTDVETASHCYIQRVVRFPGTGKDYPVNPGKSIVVAMNAKNHIDPTVITQTVDLSAADFECYVEGTASSFPSDNNAPNMLTEVFAAMSFQAKFGVTQGAALVLFTMSQSEIESAETIMAPGYESMPQYAPYCLAVPNEKVIDAVDVYRPGYESRRGKHVPTVIDASYAAVNQRCIADRKISYITMDGRKVLQDTNNSAQDFVFIEPRTEGGADHLVIRDYDKPEIQPAK